MNNNTDIKLKNNRKTYIILGICITLILITIAGTYAWITWKSNETTISGNSGCFNINYVKGQDVTGELTVGEDYITGRSTDIKMYSSPNCNVVAQGTLYLTTNASSTFDFSSGALRYSVVVNDDVVATGAVTGKTNQIIYNNFYLNRKETTYKVYLWLDSKLDTGTGDETYSGFVHAEARQVMGVNPSLALDTLVDLNLATSIKNDIPDFSKTSCSSGCGEAKVGIYRAEDDLGDSYYFRGDVNSNYVNFANKYWRIIRINGDGTIRMIYDGTSAHANGESSTDRQLDVIAFNENADDNACVGYMYGTPGSSTYEKTHENKNNSTIKTYVDNWYQANLSSYSTYIADAIYCNDRKVSRGTGIGTIITDYFSNFRLDVVSSKQPNLICDQVNDRFTVNDTINGVAGNSVLTYPIGLITADELSLGGALAGWNSASNDKYYLYTGGYYWTMSPYDFDSDYSSNYTAYSGVFAYLRSYNNASSARPVISLKADALKSGTGTMSDPFKIS